MELNREVTGYRLQVTDFLWRFAILLLPWQVRWFASTPMIGGYPWEQGRLSFYVSWVVMLFVIGVAVVVGARHAVPLRQKRWLFLGFVLCALPSLFSIFPHATIQWWLEILILIGFVWALRQFRVDRRSLATWFVISLIPHVLLAFYESATQMVIGSKWLGMASQNPLTQGVAVIAYHGERVLRAYGGFPHPNIFGGWLAVALPLVFWLACTASRKSEMLLWNAIAVVSNIALVLTFSRAAWLAALVGLMLMIIFCHSHDGYRGNPSDGSPGLAATRPRMTKQFLFSIIIIFLAASLTLFSQRHLVMSRVVTGEHLEQKSISERQLSFQQGWSLFLQHPLIGVGPGATAYALQSQIIPHFVPLLILNEIGLVGVFGLILLTLPLLERGRWRELSPMAFIPFIIILILSLLDHYLWSLWSGRTLVALVATFFILGFDIERKIV